VEAYRRATDSRSHVLRLTPEGVRLRERIHEIIGRRTPIVAE